MELGQTFDLARVYGAGAAIKGQRMENQMREQQLGMKQVFEDTARAAIDPQTGQYSPSKHAAGLTSAGYPQAGQQLLTQQIETADKFMTYAARVMPYMTAESYPAAKKQLEAGGVPPGILPEHFDPVAINGLVERLKGNREDAVQGMQKMGAGPGNTEIWGQPAVRPGGEAKNVKVIRPDRPERAPSPIAVPNGDGTVTYRDPSRLAGTTAKTNPTGNSQGTAFKFTASDTNAIHHQALSLFGGMYDPMTGEISGMDPNQMTRVQAVAARASKIYRAAAGEIDHASAVQQALSEVSGQRPIPGPYDSIPSPEASQVPPANALKSGVVTTFKNGQKWTLGATGQAQLVQ